MEWYQLFVIHFILLKNVHCLSNHKSIGCYEAYLDGKIKEFQDKKSTDAECVHFCIEAYYRYAFLKISGNCFCGNAIGRHYSDEPCNMSCVNCDSKNHLVDMYKAAIVPGPCKDVRISNVTSTSARLTWDIPHSFDPILYYQIHGKVLHTYASYKLNPFSLRYYEGTKVDLSSLHPGTEYNVTIYAVNKEGKGEDVHYIFNTIIGEPDHQPLPPKLIFENDTIAQIQLMPVYTNNNGPISSYLIIVKNMNSVQAFDKDHLISYHDAIRDGISYYIAAELTPMDIDRPFLIGDENNYMNYYNAKLHAGVKYEYIIGVKSVKEQLTKYSFSNNSYLISTPFITYNSGINNEGYRVLDVILYISIIVIILLIIAVIIGFIILKRKISVKNRQRLSDNQELTLQGPMIDMENNGYIHDDDLPPINHKEALRSQVWNIPRRLLNKENGLHLGQGRYGSIQSGFIDEIDRNSKSISIYSIVDERLNGEEKRNMLRDLSVLIRSQKHINVIKLIGICEDLDTVNVVVEHTSTNLKEMLLNSRNGSQGKISTIPETTLIDFAIQICKGMAHLESKHIVHKQLCSRNIACVNGIPKVTGLGLAQYNRSNLSPIYSRWTAKEIFMGQPYISKSDIWSFACLLWEICSIGATPYGNVTSNDDIPDKIISGMRLKQLQYIDDSLYQIMLNCWQIDMDERPNFIDLIDDLSNLIEDSYTNYLNLNFYPNFHYEQYYSELELIPKNM